MFVCVVALEEKERVTDARHVGNVLGSKSSSSPICVI